MAGNGWKFVLNMSRLVIVTKLHSWTLKFNSKSSGLIASALFVCFNASKVSVCMSLCNKRFYGFL